MRETLIKDVDTIVTSIPPVTVNNRCGRFFESAARGRVKVLYYRSVADGESLKRESYSF